MLNETIKALRKAKGLSQEELAIKLNVVRQTVSKWEQGLSVPDADMLIRLADALDTTVAALLGEVPQQPAADDTAVLAAKLELLNRQFAARNERSRRLWRIFFISLLIAALLGLAAALLPMLWLQHGKDTIVNSVGIIGGADGPTAIFVARAIGGSIFLPLLAAAAAIIAIVGICRTGRKG